MAIGYFKCGNISCSRFAGIDQANASPCKRCTSELDRQHVADHTRKTAIAVRERMDGNEPVAESDGNFIGWVGSMLDPISRVVDQLRSEEHTSELQSLMRTSYAVFCLKK